MQRHGWILLFHDCIVEQLQKLQLAAERARRNDPKGHQNNANVKLFSALAHLILEIVPSDPARDEYRLGNTLGPAFRHWRRAKIGRRFRLFFRYHSRSRTIVFAWVNPRPAEVETLLGDPTKAREKLGWVPEITAREMCAEMIAEDLKTARRHALLKEHGLELPVSLENG